MTIIDFFIQAVTKPYCEITFIDSFLIFVTIAVGIGIGFFIAAKIF